MPRPTLRKTPVAAALEIEDKIRASHGLDFDLTRRPKPEKADGKNDGKDDGDEALIEG